LSLFPSLRAEDEAQSSRLEASERQFSGPNNRRAARLGRSEELGTGRSDAGEVTGPAHAPSSSPQRQGSDHRIVSWTTKKDE
jgi:hypothetical protein